MKKTRLCKTLMAAVLTLFSALAFTQEKLSIENVHKVILRNTGSIINGEEVKGYYSFYQSDKLDKNTNEYTVQILDQYLNKVKSFKFTDSKNVSLIESSYNGGSLIFFFYNRKDKLVDYRIYGLDGKQTASYTKAIDKKTQRLIDYSLSVNTEETENKTIFDINNLGFVSVLPDRDGKQYSYDIDFYFSDKKKQWVYSPTDEIKFAQAQFMGYNDNMILFEVLKKEKLMSKKVETWLLALDIETGKKIFEVSTDNEQYEFYPMNIFTLKGSSDFYVAGTYYDKDDKVMVDKSLGIAVYTMNGQGKVTDASYNSWTTDIGKYIKTNSKGKIDNIGYLFFHKIIQASDGKIFAIGEGYRKQASALGIAARMLTSNSNISVTKMQVTDMVMIELNNAFKVTNATIYDKNNNNVEMPAGAEFTSPHTLALLLKAYGDFDYSFTQTDNDHTVFTVGYTDYERSKDYKGLTFHTISYSSNQMTTDKIPLSTKASKLHIYPGQPGSILIVEYFRKDKRLEFRMEKLN